MHNLFATGCLDSVNQFLLGLRHAFRMHTSEGSRTLKSGIILPHQDISDACPSKMKGLICLDVTRSESLDS